MSHITSKIALLFFTCFFVATCSNVYAEWPDRPVKFILGSQSGGSIDTVGRILAKHLSDKYGQPFVASNVSGGGLGAFPMLLKNSRNDGYTIGMGADMNFSYNSLEPTSKFTMEDFAPVCTVFKGDCSFVAKGDKEWKNVREALEQFKAEGKKVRYLFQTSKDRMMFSFFAKQVGTEVALIPSRGPSSILTSLMGNHGDIGFSGGLHYEQARAGKIKTLTLTTATRSKNYPDVPTVNELFSPCFNFDAYRIIIVPKGFPPAIKAQLENDIKEITESEEFKKMIDQLHFVIAFNSGDQTMSILGEQLKENKRMLDTAK